MSTTYLLVPDFTDLAPYLSPLPGVQIIPLEPKQRGDAFTPWPAVIPALHGGGRFGGKANAYLNKLMKTIPTDGKLGIIGVSLGGLFAVYATITHPVFSFCASISGSFWYPGWTTWLVDQPIPQTSYYFCSGENEGRGRKDELRESRTATDFTSTTLRGTYQTDPYGHMHALDVRMEQTLSWIQSQLSPVTPSPSVHNRSGS